MKNLKLILITAGLGLAVLFFYKYNNLIEENQRLNTEYTQAKETIKRQNQRLEQLLKLQDEQKKELENLKTQGDLLKNEIEKIKDKNKKWANDRLPVGVDGLLNKRTIQA